MANQESQYPNGVARQVLQTPAAPVMSENKRVDQHQTQGSTPQFKFRKAVKQDAKLRLAVVGPSGSGKTYTLLKLATELGGPIAVIDTERGSAEKYADLFDFDVLPLTSFDPRMVPPAIDAAARAGYRVLIMDSLSHFYSGVDGELEQVDRVKLRMRDNSWAAWKEVTPMHNRLVDAMISAPIHILVAMRAKTEWVVEKDSNGNSKPRKVGLQPVMRDGIEYEFDVCADMDQENNFIVSKTRCPEMAQKVFNKPGKEMASILKTWLVSPDPERKPSDQAQTATPATTTTVPPESANPELGNRPWRNRGEMKDVFQRLRERVGETRFAEEMALAGISHPAQFRSSKAAMQAYNRITFLAAQAEVA